MSDQIREDQAEHAFWQFDARRKGYAEWRGAPQSERDAFKAEYRQALGARPDAASPATASGDELPEQWHERTEKMDDASIIAAMKSEIAELRAAVSAATKPAPLDIDKLERFDHRGAMMAPDPTGDYLLVSDVRSLLATKPAAPTDASLYADEATRLRHVVTLLGIQHQVPGNDAALRDCLFSVLGLIARKLEVRATKPAAAQAVPEGWTVTHKTSKQGNRYVIESARSIRSISEDDEPTLFRFFTALAAAPMAQEQAKAEGGAA